MVARKPCGWFKEYIQFYFGLTTWNQQCQRVYLSKVKSIQNEFSFRSAGSVDFFSYRRTLNKIKLDNNNSPIHRYQIRSVDSISMELWIIRKRAVYEEEEKQRLTTRNCLRSVVWDCACVRLHCEQSLCYRKVQKIMGPYRKDVKFWIAKKEVNKTNEEE